MIYTYRYYNIVKICDHRNDNTYRYYNIVKIYHTGYYNIVKICDHRNDIYIQVL